MNIVLAVAIILLLGIGGGKLARNYLGLPSVTGYIFAGILIGPSFLDLIDIELQEALQPVNDIALGIIAVAIGGELRLSHLRSIWGDLCRVFFSEAIITFAIVAFVTGWVAASLPVGLLLGTLSLASAPNTTLAVFRDFRLKGDFPRTLLSLVALDNLFCLVLFSVIVGTLSLLLDGVTNNHIWLQVISALFLSLVIGIILGFVLVYFNKKTKSDNELLVLSLGVIFLGVGLGIWLDLQPLFISMVIGLVMVNFSSRYTRFFGVLQRVDTPVLIAFLTLAGVKIQLGHLIQVGFLGLAYIASRFVGKIAGCHLGARFCRKLPQNYESHLGPSLTPQAGVAVGLSIMVERNIPVVEGQIVPVILGAVIIFEIIGPLLLRRALYHTDSIKADVGS